MLMLILEVWMYSKKQRSSSFENCISRAAISAFSLSVKIRGTPTVQGSFHMRLYKKDIES